jgi:arylsulfatase A-like enzyme
MIFRTALLLFCIVSVIACSLKQKNNQEKPNIIYIYTDQQSANMMSCAGNEWLKTPAMDYIAENGLRFTRAYAPNPVCSPARVSYMTGRMPSYFKDEDGNPIRENHKSMKIPQVSQEVLNSTLAHYLKQKAGYYRSILEDNIQLDSVLTMVDNYLDENTLFIYSDDHGVNGKFTVYDRGLNVPFVARWPKVIEPGSTCNNMIHYTDVLPTFLEIAGGELPNNLDGKSFLNLLKGGKDENHKYVYGIRTSQNILAASVSPSRMIRSKKFKYIRNFNSIEVMEQNFGQNKTVNAFIKMGALKHKHLPFEEMYDLEADPFEQKNLAHKSAYHKIKEELASQMFKWMKEQGDILDDTPGNMPLIKPGPRFKLDEPGPYREVPDSLRNTLKDEDYLILDYL